MTSRNTQTQTNAMETKWSAYHQLPVNDRITGNYIISLYHSTPQHTDYSNGNKTSLFLNTRIRRLIGARLKTSDFQERSNGPADRHERDELIV